MYTNRGIISTKLEEACLLERHREMYSVPLRGFTYCIIENIGNIHIVILNFL